MPHLPPHGVGAPIFTKECSVSLVVLTSQSQTRSSCPDRARAWALVSNLCKWPKSGLWPSGCTRSFWLLIYNGPGAREQAGPPRRMHLLHQAVQRLWETCPHVRVLEFIWPQPHMRVMRKSSTEYLILKPVLGNPFFKWCLQQYVEIEVL